MGIHVSHTIPGKLELRNVLGDCKIARLQPLKNSDDKFGAKLNISSCIRGLCWKLLLVCTDPRGSLIILPEGVVVGLPNFLTHINIRIPTQVL
jgi:hypothetical protein